MRFQEVEETNWLIVFSQDPEKKGKKRFGAIVDN